MSEPEASRPPFHYAWVIVATGMLAIVACLGFGRFALGMLLPSMASTLKLSYSQIGFISTGNFVGYLLSVLFCGHIARKIGSRRLIVIALVIIGASMAFISRAGSFTAILVLYFITGMGSGAANVPVMGLITAWFDRTVRGRAAGFVVIGSGFAIIVSGKLIPYVNRLLGPEGWRTNWLILAGVVTAIAAVGHVFLRNKPEDLGQVPDGPMSIKPGKATRSRPTQSTTSECGSSSLRGISRVDPTHMMRSARIRTAPFSMMPSSDMAGPHLGAGAPRKVTIWPMFFINSIRPPGHSG